MSFVSKNELDHFSYRDCVLKNIEVGSDITLSLVSLIVEPTNSANTNFTRSYAGDTVLTIKDGKIEKIVKDGAKYYDSDENLIEAVPDLDISPLEYLGLLEKFKDVYLYDVRLLSSDTLVLGIELMPEDKEDPTEITDSYQVKITYSEAIATWERYMNRVEQ